MMACKKLRGSSNFICSAYIVFTLAMIVISYKSAMASGENPDIAGYTREEALRYGERIYMEGILPSGKPVRAFVQGDIPVEGSMFACELCHRKSGLGTSEGFVVVLPTNGPNLLRPRAVWDPWRRHSQEESVRAGSRKIPKFFQKDDLRPEYTDETLSKAIRSGRDPSGRMLDYIMPRYDLNDHEMAVLTYYLKNLSARLSTGVTDNTLHFATVVTEDVSRIDRDAMISVLNAHIKDRNAQSRNQSERAKRGAFIKRERDVAYRLLTLSVWELKGPKESWLDQLEEYYKKEPVFALIGGIAEDWEPIHMFSEQNNIPCIFPITDRPVISERNWNTLYFSKGLYQEGEGAARYLRRVKGITKESRIIQVFREGSDGDVIAKGFQETWSEFRLRPPENNVLQSEESITEEFWRNLPDSAKNTVVLLWTGKENLESIQRLSDIPHDRLIIFVSSRLLEEDLPVISDKLRDFVFITYPYSLPGDKEVNTRALETWLRIKTISPTNLRIQSKMYFVGWMLAEMLMGMRSEFYRDYFIEKIEMMTDQSHAIAVYPRLSFGPWQRYASKGCYIVQLTKGKNPTIVKKSEWVVH